MSRLRAALLLGFALELAAFIAIRSLDDAAAALGAALGLLALAASGFLIALYAAHRAGIGLRAILFAGLLLRLPLLGSAPSLSDDVWRYIHDGRAQLAGVNPYAFAPADSATLPFRGAEHPRINHPHLVTIYPPFAQTAFLLNAALGGTVVTWKLVLFSAEATIVLLLAAMLRRSSRPIAGVLLYAWHPLVVLEIAGNAHLEPIAVAPMLAAFVLAAGSRPAAAGFALGLSVTAKYVALPIMPFLDRQRVWRVVAGTVAAILLVALPYLAAGTGVFGSLLLFGKSWASNGAIFLVLEKSFGSYGGRAAAVALLCAALVFLWLRRYPAEMAAFSFLFATLLLSPVVHPWYLIWLVALIPLARVPALVRTAALYWTLVVPAAYLAIPVYRETGEWRVPTAAVLLQYLPVLILLCAGFIRRAARHSAMPVEVPSG